MRFAELMSARGHALLQLFCPVLHEHVLGHTGGRLWNLAHHQKC